MQQDYNIERLRRGDVTPSMLREVVRLAQLELGVQPDGLFGPETRAALLEHLAHRVVPAGERLPLRVRALGNAVLELGQGEQGVNNEGVALSRYRKATGLPGGPWCALLVSYCFHQAALEAKEKLTFELSSSAERLFENMVAAGGRVIEIPEPASIGLWSRDGGHHIAFFEYLDESDLSVIRLHGNFGPFPALVHRQQMVETAWRHNLKGIVVPPG